MKIRFDGKLFEVCLSDDGTMDTVISVQPVAMRTHYNGQRPTYWPRQESRFDGEYASSFRRSNSEMTVSGFRSLALEACEAYYFE